MRLSEFEICAVWGAPSSQQHCHHHHHHHCINNNGNGMVVPPVPPKWWWWCYFTTTNTMPPHQWGQGWHNGTTCTCNVVPWAAHIHVASRHSCCTYLHTKYILFIFPYHWGNKEKEKKKKPWLDIYILLELCMSTVLLWQQPSAVICVLWLYCTVTRLYRGEPICNTVTTVTYCSLLYSPTQYLNVLQIHLFMINHIQYSDNQPRFDMIHQTYVHEDCRYYNWRDWEGTTLS